MCFGAIDHGLVWLCYVVLGKLCITPFFILFDFYFLFVRLSKLAAGRR